MKVIAINGSSRENGNKTQIGHLIIYGCISCEEHVTTNFI